jgi:hypothetical protein
MKDGYYWVKVRDDLGGCWEPAYYTSGCTWPWSVLGLGDSMNPDDIVEIGEMIIPPCNTQE